MEDYIKFDNISKSFGGQKALEGVSFSIRKGELHAILGENGAGKSTLLNVFHGVLAATTGDVYVDGKKTNFGSAVDAIKYGIAKVHQEINIIPEMTVAQNIMLGNEPTKNGFLDTKTMNRTAGELLDRLGCTFSPEDKIGTLSTGKKQLVQIARALQLNATIISMDEPTTSLSSSEVSALFKIIDNLRAQGITILYVSHKLDEVLKLCDKATVLRDGKYVNTFTVSEITGETLVKSMVGRDISMFAKRHMPSCADMNDVVLDIRGLNSEIGFKDINFQLHRGEILGFFGLVGAMRTEVMRAIFGADRSYGSVTMYGRNMEKRTPYVSVQAGVGLISENRKEEGFVPTMSNMQNICLASISQFLKGPFLKKGQMAEKAKQTGKIVGLVPNDPEFMTKNLSGGNAQKVILAKWLSTNANILIFDEPTKGIDIGAKAEIYKLMEELVSQGKSIIMVSSELPEIIGMSDRVLIMRAGRIEAELQRDEFSEDRIIKVAVGGYEREKSSS